MGQPLKNSTPALPLCFIAALYGIGFGVMMLPTALFVGPEMLAAALSHIGFGIAFLVAARGIRRHKPWALATAAICGGLVGLAGLLAIAQSISQKELGGLVFWSPFTLYFLCLATIAAWHWRYPEQLPD